MLDLENFKEILQEILNRQVEISLESNAQSVNGWDSLNHIFLLLALEKKFSFRFRIGEAETAQNVAELIAIVNKRIAVANEKLES